MKEKTFLRQMLNGIRRRSWLFMSATAVAMTTMTVFTSCIKDEEPNKECDIEKAWVDEAYVTNFYDEASMKEDLSSTQLLIEFEVRSLMSLSKEIAIHFQITPGATIMPENGSKQDFSNGPVTYTVTSQDGEWTKQYKVKFVESRMPTSTFSFEHVRAAYKKNIFQLYNTFHEFVEVNGNDTINCWASGNEGAAMIKQNTMPKDQPTYQDENGYKGKCVCMTTQSAGDMGAMVNKPIAAGNLFLGQFVVDKVLTNPLETTRFGLTYKHDPLRVKGWYKYKPGKEFTNAKKEKLTDRVDEADIYAVLYRNKDVNNPESKESYYLYGNDVSEEKLKQNPQVWKIARVKSLPATDEWTPFEMFFEGKDPDDKLLAEGAYNLTLVFSSSKDGASFEGSVGSTLYIDEVEIIYEK